MFFYFTAKQKQRRVDIRHTGQVAGIHRVIQRVRKLPGVQYNQVMLGA
jgi:hypothetical protein